MAETIDEWKARCPGGLMNAGSRWEGNVRVEGAKKAVLCTDGTIFVNDDEDVLRAIAYLSRLVDWLKAKPGLGIK